MRWTITLLLAFLYLHATAQVTISGKVLSDQSGEPLSGASVYINNSTIGSTTGADGHFNLPGVRPGTYDIIVSFISYEVIVHTVQVGYKDLKFQFRMQPKPQQMRNILVVGDERRKKLMELFRSQFLGITLAGEKCRIENEGDISFAAGEGKKDVFAYADKPLVIVNRELGYRITFDLQEFYVDEVSGRTYFYGYSRYEDLEKGSLERYRKKRRQYYQGSNMNFYHALYAGTTASENFRIIRKLGVQENGRVRVVNQEIDPGTLVKTDSATNRKYMAWEDKISVQYLRDPVYKSALFKKTLVMGSLARGVESDLTILERPAYFSDLGLPENPLRIAISRFWSYEKFGVMLPIDYRPED